MRKFLLSTLLVSVVGFASAQVTFGLRVAPQFSFNRVEGETALDLGSFGTSGSGVRFAVGPFIEFELVDKVGLYTGAWFSTKRSSFSYSSPFGGGEYVYNLAYVQIPVGFKFYTGDLIANKFRLYFDIGGTFDIKTGENLKEYPAALDEPENDYAKAIDAMVGLTIGSEFDLGINNKLFFGIGYRRGLLNITQKDFDANQDGNTLKISNDLLAIEVGIKF